MTRLTELKAQIAQLDDLIRTGVLTGEAARQRRDQLESEILECVLLPAQGHAVPASGSAALPNADAPGPSKRLVVALGVFVLVLAAAGYAWRGQPDALDASAGKPGASDAAPTAAGHEPGRAQFEAMVERLAERLKTQPDDAEGWAMLGRSHSVLTQFPQAVAAHQKVIALRPGDAQAHADLADAMGMANGRKLDGEPEKLIAKALQLDPDNAKALGLAGTIALGRGDPGAAAKHWERALRKVEPGSDMANNLLAAANEARQQIGQAPLAAPPALAVPGAGVAPVAADSAQTAAPPAGTGASVQVRITLSPSIAAKAAPGDTLFVFARAPQGGRAPLAILRKQVKDLPLSVTLDDSLAMSPAMRLSSATQVIVGARISKSGNAMPQPGDLQGLSAVVPVGTKGLQIEINEALP